MPRKKPELPVIWCRIPDSLDLDNLLRQHPAVFSPVRRDVIAALSEYLYRRAAIDGNMDDWGFVSLRSTHMQVLHDDYSKYVNWLCDVGVWERDGPYEPGKSSRGYRWSVTYAGSAKVIILNDPVVIKAMIRLRRTRINEYKTYRSQSVEEAIGEPIFYFQHITDPEGFRRANLHRWLDEQELSQEIHRWLMDRFHAWGGCSAEMDLQHSSISLSSSALCSSPYVRESVPEFHLPNEEEQRLTYGWLQKSVESVRIVEGWEEHSQSLLDSGLIQGSKFEATRSCMEALKESIESGSFEFRVLPTNRRIRTMVTEMPRAGRSFLSLDGCTDLTSLDITCCQPFLMLPLARELGQDEQNIAAMYSAIGSDLYAVLGKRLFGRDITEDERDSIKKPILKSLYSKNVQKVKVNGTDVKDALSELFPHVYNVSRAFKDLYAHNEFAIFMQKLEADFMIKLVGNELRKAGIQVLTVHDCVIVKRVDAKRVREIIEWVGRAYTGLTPFMKEKALTRSLPNVCAVAQASL